MTLDNEKDDGTGRDMGGVADVTVDEGGRKLCGGSFLFSSLITGLTGIAGLFPPPLAAGSFCPTAEGANDGLDMATGVCQGLLLSFSAVLAVPMPGEADADKTPPDLGLDAPLFPSVAMGAILTRS